MRKKVLGALAGATVLVGISAATQATPANAMATPCQELGAAMIYHIGHGNLAYAEQLFYWAVDAGCAD